MAKKVPLKKETKKSPEGTVETKVLKFKTPEQLTEFLLTLTTDNLIQFTSATLKMLGSATKKKDMDATRTGIHVATAILATMTVRLQKVERALAPEGKA